MNNQLAEEVLSIIQQIRSTGMRAAVAISPDTPSSVITDDIGNTVDMILVMTVYPGKNSLSLSLLSSKVIHR